MGFPADIDPSSAELELRSGFADLRSEILGSANPLRRCGNDFLGQGSRGEEQRSRKPSQGAGFSELSRREFGRKNGRVRLVLGCKQ